jgi:hypothetical protein
MHKKLRNIYDGAAIDDVLHLERYRRGILRISEDAVVGKTTSFARTGGTHQAHNGLARTMGPVVEAITIVMSVCRCSFSTSDVINTIIDVMSPCSSTIRERVSILVDGVATATC